MHLRRENPDWIERTRRAARGGEGRLETVILMAYIEPGSQDLALLHRRLMATNTAIAERRHTTGCTTSEPPYSARP